MKQLMVAPGAPANSLGSAALDEYRNPSARTRVFNVRIGRDARLAVETQWEKVAWRTPGEPVRRLKVTLP